MMPPYHCLYRSDRVLLAASLSGLDLFNLDDGLQLSSWTNCTLFKDNSIETPAPLAGNDLEPPAKKRRLSSTNNGGGMILGSIATDKSKQHVSKLGKQEIPVITALTSTRSGDHVIVLTGEDKCIRVFEHYSKGQLQCISQRVMPKRPCAITLTPDENTIVCGDKFGDVYAIPLLCSGLATDPQCQVLSPETKKLDTKPSRPFVPAANDLTVHSIRNRKALQNQIKQNHNAREKSEPQFERRLLLGHVSMLTDIALIYHDGKNYIITADRDEHIRISRGIPQAHIIEGYCLGHREFVSRLCFPTGRPNLLISGGGDNNIYIWDWRLGRLLQKFNMKIYTENLAADMERDSAADDEKDSINVPLSEPVRTAVSNIEYMLDIRQQDDLIMVTCEGIPAIFIFSFQGNYTISHYHTLNLDGNPLDIVVDSRSESVIVSIDSTHRPGSAIQLRNDQDPIVEALQCFRRFGSEWVKGPIGFNIDPEAATRLNCNDEYEAKKLIDLLYPMQKLRKTGGEY